MTEVAEVAEVPETARLWRSGSSGSSGREGDVARAHQDKTYRVFELLLREEGDAGADCRVRQEPSEIGHGLRPAVGARERETPEKFILRGSLHIGAMLCSVPTRKKRGKRSHVIIRGPFNTE